MPFDGIPLMLGGESVTLRPKQLEELVTYLRGNGSPANFQFFRDIHDALEGFVLGDAFEAVGNYVRDEHIRGLLIKQGISPSFARQIAPAPDLKNQDYEDIYHANRLFAELESYFDGLGKITTPRYVQQMAFPTEIEFVVVGKLRPTSVDGVIFRSFRYEVTFEGKAKGELELCEEPLKALLSDCEDRNEPAYILRPMVQKRLESQALRAYTHIFRYIRRNRLECYPEAIPPLDGNLFLHG